MAPRLRYAGLILAPCSLEIATNYKLVNDTKTHRNACQRGRNLVTWSIRFRQVEA